MKPILCIGESKEEYEAGLNKDICAVQLGKGLSGITKEMVERIVIAYEPVWAIGTGLTATPEIAQSVHSFIRGWITSRYGQVKEIQIKTLSWLEGLTASTYIEQLE